MTKNTYKITEQDGVVRVDKFLAHKFPEYSRAAIAKLFTLNLIKLNGEPIQPGHKLRPGTIFEYDLGPLQEKPEVIPLPIIYEDENVIVIDKPAGIISHARGKFWQEASVASFIRDRIRGMDGDRGGIVHRLDRATSGVMICAKNENTLSYLQKQFSDRKVTKTYVAVVQGVPKITEAIIDAQIGRDLKDPKRFKIDKEGKSAQTHYKLVKTNNKFSTLELKPKTGRTHQLRVHLKYINLPIVGDLLYGDFKYPRLMLHAAKLKIKLPDGEDKTFTAPIPSEFSEVYN
ncbi:RluA family pseudouridine synthase [Candidatus Saccharibacteria bacterium]|nr:RluA family pseudouridine synthase [Candidatus Saccharibacteria bacterium]